MKTLTLLSAVSAICFALGCTSSKQQAYTAESIINAQQSRPPTTAPAATATGKVAPSFPIEDASGDQYYPNESAGHWVVTVLDRGVQIKLEDASLWEIAPKDQGRTMLWRVADTISVGRWPDPQFPHRLTNDRTGDTADARLVSSRERP